MEIAMRDFRKLLLALLLTGCSTAPSTPIPDDLTPSASFTVREEQVMRIAAGIAGKGTLIYQGWQYPFIFENAKVDIAGDTPVEVVGTVYHLKRYEDFEGVYKLIKAEIETGDGLSGLWAKNAKGVVLHVRTQGQDVAINAEATGMKVTFK
jgi:hypothetical protein